MPLFIAVKEGMVLLPLAINPIDGVLFDQLNMVVPPVLLVPKVIAGTVSPLHTMIFDTVFT